jgi:hypothetical protein
VRATARDWANPGRTITATWPVPLLVDSVPPEILIATEVLTTTHFFAISVCWTCAAPCAMPAAWRVDLRVDGQPVPRTSTATRRARWHPAACRMGSASPST